MSCFRVAGRLSVARLTQSLRASKHDGGASLVQQAPFISAFYVRIGPGLAALGKSLFSCVCARGCSSLRSSASPPAAIPPASSIAADRRGVQCREFKQTYCLG